MPSKTETKQEYQKKIQAQFDQLDARVELLKAKSAEATADVKIEYLERMAELRAKRDSAKVKLQELQQASDEAWTEMQSGFEKAWNELSQSWKDASAKF